MSELVEILFRDTLEHRIEQIDYHQYQILIEKSKIMDLLKQKKDFAKNRDDYRG